MSSAPQPPAFVPTIASYETHTMGLSLKPYLDMKVHHLTPSRTWSEIEVIGRHIRSPPAIIFDKEKNDKPFNTQRPTATILPSNKLVINCFPGADYVRHYANILATHLSLSNKDPHIVTITPPAEKAASQIYLASNLRGLATDAPNLIIVGSIPSSTLLSHAPWHDAHTPHELFAWQTTTQPHGLKVAILHCRASFWGDLAGDLVQCLRDICGARLQCVIYVGKLGALSRAHAPNLSLATGQRSWVDGAWVDWANPIPDRFLRGVARGVHYTSASVLDEDARWLARNRAEFDWVDPEIGHMAVAGREAGVRFGYLHLVSNALEGGFEFDLGNEREGVVVQNRLRMNGWIERILKEFIADLDGKFGAGVWE
ncbi:hypothetical protein DSL72_005272 [Monilinia vaccinii-corymbosi]|uniref:Uncharacterized protein n=1 Tax=Monilinia vaccinii-corymbosi TaxID=61207 RepID=A0A8A3PF77_9HELO|nr:hypothetical protein DSL72_005272 [Monilinia vaccinii-corymbosi]